MESEAFTKERIWHGAILCSGFEENEQKMFDSITLSRLGLEQNEQKSTSILTRSQAMKQYAFVDRVETAICAVKFLFWPRDAIMIIHVKWDNWGFLLRGNTSIRQCVHSWHSSGSCLVSIPFKSIHQVATGIQQSVFTVNRDKAHMVNSLGQSS